jgi:Reverse transcriptase (RNA-dependent DNA polymerase)
VKHDFRHKARLVAGGHLIDPNTKSVYSGVVSFRGIRLIIFLEELNQLELWGADVGNAYLEAKTKEMVYIVAGPEFGELEGHTLIIFKAPYGLRSSGLCWYQQLADVMRALGFSPTKAEAEIWMRENNGLYEYVALYVDDLLIAAKILGYYWIDGKSNPADIVSKHWGYQQIWHLLKTLLFCSDNTLDLVQESENNKITALESTPLKNCYKFT